MTNPLETPVLLLVFARPAATKLVFQEIRKARPRKLYIAADGPVQGNPGSAEKCARVRESVAQVDWDCEVRTLFRETNLGCRAAVSEALHWFFSQENEGIILEDDCLPGQSFFSFCESMLEKYRNDKRVMHISGTNLQFGQKRGDASYYFSSIPSVWGWAAWKRSWEQYDVQMSLYPEFKASGLIKTILPDERVAAHVMHVLQMNYEGKISTWDHQYGFSLVINNGLCIVPNVNLISNLGYSKTDDPLAADNYLLSRIPVEEITFPLTHPVFFVPDKEADLFQAQLDVFDFKKHTA
ncbi:hypothetical protein Q4E93_07395 [Flavitalea sp. BT771]|uniref:hypothetical protein n=1 Tax=Flavitalea sp. BT771 TaxID=3063329 RepID=UPI0026E41816|nr:hypothetical protein [Flavitalea sp. BT771]MDO6430404.1 hypothetical protein [Flavitalea sp. BT771]MDV6219456.1 hypothetical protein [Flavitalea sp. BT771]